MKLFDNLFNLLFLILLNITSVSFAQNVQVTKNVIPNGGDKELNIKEIDLGYKKVDVETYKLLKQKNEAAKIVYEKMSSHPKLITEKLMASRQFLDQLKLYKLIHLSYDSRNIQFNSLIIKTILENPKIHYVKFTTTEGYLYTDTDLDEITLNTELNNISFSPITIVNQAIK